jgi:nucleoside-diphosphate-sugar epimerase
MTIKADPKIVLVTGANGFIGSWTTKLLLDAGYHVRGVVRTSHAGEALIYGPLSSFVSDGRLSLVEVPDMTLPGAFDEPIKGCYAAAHIASPMATNFHDPDPVILTAVQGTLSILESAHAYGGDTLKAFVLLSSSAAIMGGPIRATPPYTEKDWNNFSEKEVLRLGKATPSGDIYRASKTAAERALWQFQKEKSPGFSASAIQPVFVWGPPLLLPKHPDDLNMTVKVIWQIFSGQEHPPSMGGSGGAVDVRDVARMILFCIQNRQIAASQRYFLCSGQRSEQAVADILRRGYPGRQCLIKAGTPGLGYHPRYWHPFIDSSKAVKATGQDWVGVEQSVLDAAKTFERYL